MPTQPHFVVPLAGTPRPLLPLEHLNPHIKSLDSSNLPAVKFQEIIREGQSTIVARMKVPTPAGHAFILRRLDTGAISLTTMFRAAFPTASDESERVESNWVKANFDGTGGNRGGKARFAGTWVTADVATSIASDYSLEKIISPLTDAKPDPNTEYRKSSRTQQLQQTPDKDTPAPKQLPTPAPSMSTPNPPKRRREASPAPPKLPSAAASSPMKAPLSPAATRRSQRTTSPAPSPAPKPTSPKAASPFKSPKVLRSPIRTRRTEVATPAGSDETAVEDDIPEVPGPDVNEDIREQKEMIEAFKAQRETKLQVTGDEDETMNEGLEKKREREVEAPSLQFNFKEPETQKRKIATNRRVSRLPEMTPERRSFAWGIAAFAAAFGAMTYVPTPWF
ncbi:hypothetical protein F5148DRAFT_974192 [Russula earlei]|uniref:Uncharacterized protein n=1 Tax=Russula earlei TaxID=71964 RepID=A0ACC0ULS9_9AGAM|nr:hypothetical protein F5148DRAFT_974192 [Russula earlei]